MWNASDGTIHLKFDEHASTVNYRVARPGLANRPGEISWTGAQFGPVVNYLEPGKPQKKFTYPNFLATPVSGLQLFFRNGGSGNSEATPLRVLDLRLKP